VTFVTVFTLTWKVSPLRARFVVLRPIPRCARDQHCVLSCALRAGRSSLQGTTLRCRRFAPDTCLVRPSDAFN
jgi:hypothetical protein